MLEKPISQKVVGSYFIDLKNGPFHKSFKHWNKDIFVQIAEDSAVCILLQHTLHS